MNYRHTSNNSVSLLNKKGIATACETDISNAVTMRALSLAANMPTMLLDFNNNFGTDRNKVIMFHCGRMAISLRKVKAFVSDGSSPTAAFLSPTAAFFTCNAQEYAV